MGLNKNFILSGLFVFILFTGLILNVGQDFSNSSSVTLDNESVDYISSYSDLMDEKNFTSLTQSNELDGEGILGDNESEQQSTSDIFATINFYKSRLEKVVGYFKIFVNFPSFVIEGLGLPVQPFSVFSYIFGTIFYISLILIFIRLLRGS